MHNSFSYMFIFTLYMFWAAVPIIRRINRINTTCGICHSVQMIVWGAGLHLHTKWSPIQSDIYQLSYWYN